MGNVYKLKHRTNNSGFTLIEISIAMLMMTGMVLGYLSLLAWQNKEQAMATLKSQSTAKFQEVAAAMHSLDPDPNNAAYQTLIGLDSSTAEFNAPFEAKYADGTPILGGSVSLVSANTGWTLASDLNRSSDLMMAWILFMSSGIPQAQAEPPPVATVGVKVFPNGGAGLKSMKVSMIWIPEQVMGQTLRTQSLGDFALALTRIGALYQITGVKPESGLTKFLYESCQPPYYPGLAMKNGVRVFDCVKKDCGTGIEFACKATLGAATSVSACAPASMGTEPDLTLCSRMGVGMVSDRIYIESGKTMTCPVGTYYSSGRCQDKVAATTPTCGNGHLDSGEQCDSTEPGCDDLCHIIPPTQQPGGGGGTL